MNYRKAHGSRSGTQQSRRVNLIFVFHLVCNPCVSVSLVYLVGAWRKERNELPGAPAVGHHEKCVTKSHKNMNSVEEFKGKLLKYRSTGMKKQKLPNHLGDP